MEWNDVVDVLTAAQAFDRRTVGEADIAAWQAAFAAAKVTSRADALTAVTGHYASSRDWLMPYDVISRVKAIHRDRIRRVDADNVMGDFDLSLESDRVQWVETSRMRYSAIAEGATVAEAIAAHPRRAELGQP
jgi:hypothetical protein